MKAAAWFYGQPGFHSHAPAPAKARPCLVCKAEDANDEGMCAPCWEEYCHDMTVWEEEMRERRLEKERP